MRKAQKYLFAICNMKRILILLIINCLFCIAHCQNVRCGADRLDQYLSLLKGKRVGIVAHKASYIYTEALDKKALRKYKITQNTHLVDLLATQNINIECVFAPEHGFRGTADAGEKVSSGVDEQTGIMVRSLYDGNTGRPSDSIMSLLDVVLFDLQDVGLRYYTYLTTMVKMMEACATHHVQMIVLDRPNPNGHYVDGPILDMKYRSAVGYLPVPVVHGMTLGEIAHMVNGEGWLPDSAQCNIKVITCENYTHQTLYQLPVAPSPNLPNMRSVYLYPAMCYFEATPVSLGRGTDYPFQCYGHPNMLGYEYSFTPTSRFGAKTPPQQDLQCYGVDLTTHPSIDTIFSRGVDLTYLIDAYQNLHLGDHFFRPFFEKLIGVDWVRKMIKSGKTADEIRVMWQEDVAKFRQKRAKYLLYAE